MMNKWIGKYIMNKNKYNYFSNALHRTYAHTRGVSSSLRHGSRSYNLTRYKKEVYSNVRSFKLTPKT